jgi:hypothetical protein
MHRLARSHIRLDLRFGPAHAVIYCEGKKAMLWTLFLVLLVLWALGMLTSVGGSLIHILLVIALIVLVFNLVRGRRIFS